MSSKQGFTASHAVKDGRKGPQRRRSTDFEEQAVRCLLTEIARRRKAVAGTGAPSYKSPDLQWLHSIVGQCWNGARQNPNSLHGKVRYLTTRPTHNKSSQDSKPPFDPLLKSFLINLRSNTLSNPSPSQLWEAVLWIYCCVHMHLAQEVLGTITQFIRRRLLLNRVSCSGIFSECSRSLKRNPTSYRVYFDMLTRFGLLG